MSYLESCFLENIDKSKVKSIFELGSRDLVDASRLFSYYGCPIYAFECNPDCLEACKRTYASFSDRERGHIYLINRAVSLENGYLTFYAFDLSKYDNMGSSSLLKIDFTKRDQRDPDYNRPNPQKEVKVQGTRLDTFIEQTGVIPDMVCMDLQGYELNAIRSMGSYIQRVKYILTECSLRSTYTGGVSFRELDSYLRSQGFRYVCSNKFGSSVPDESIQGHCEFDALYVNMSI